MGLLARYIDALPDHAKDRIIEAQDWGLGALVDADGKRCLLGHAEDWIYEGSIFKNRARDTGLQVWRNRTFGPSSHLDIGSRFDRLCHKRNLDRVILLIKQRAARGYRLAELAPQRSTRSG
jgi:hypothetical protein